jgi:DHA1 family bicyclomycin/chloramphenicol resistance-like MFS transporter
MKFSKSQLNVIYTLSLLTALEALSIDLYLPAFYTMAKDFNASVEKIQISLSIFIGGFAVGQLIWGFISDKFGRKKPLLLATLIFIIASFAISFATSIGELWFWRFIQAFSGSAGVVISRAIVKDSFNNKNTITVFTILNMLMGIVPIIAPILGNFLLKMGHWQYIFVAIGFIGMTAQVMILAFIKESSFQNLNATHSTESLSDAPDFKYVFHDRQFIIYTLIGSLCYSALMIYISGSPFLLMVKAGFDETQYSFLFALNSVGIIGASYLVNLLVKHFKLKSIVKTVAILQTIFALSILFMANMNYSIYAVLVLLFLYLMAVGIFLPSTIELALERHRKKSGRASALFGFIQLSVAFVFSTIMGILQKGSELPLIVGLLLCAILSVVLSLFDFSKKEDWKIVKMK